MRKRILASLTLFPLIGIMGWSWLHRPLIMNHPDFGTDCVELTRSADLADQVDCVRVWYGTNRTLIPAPFSGSDGLADILRGTGTSSERLQLGRADVWLPKLVEAGGSRNRGETPHARGRAPEDSDRQAQYVFLTRITAEGQTQFTTTLQDAIDRSGTPSLLLFIHGFNVKFDEALVRTAQLATDLSASPSYDVGTPVLFSWPSAGEMSLEQYNGDRDQSLGAAPYLEAFLNLLTQDIEVRRINIIAHSMGNRVLTQALQDYARDYLDRRGRTDLEFRILLVAADVERDVFAAANGIFDNLDANITIYASDTDRALHVSNIVNQKKRLGDTDKNKPYIRAHPRYQTIDATAVATELFGIGHNYYSDNPSILWDMMCTIGRAAPEERALELARYGNDPNGAAYFRVNPALTPDNSACKLRRSAFPAGLVPPAPDIPAGLEEVSPMPPPPPPIAAPADPDPVLSPQGTKRPLRILIDSFQTDDLSPYEASLEALLGAGDIRDIVITAHTDRVGTVEDNLIRSQQVAEAFKAWFVARGVPADVIIAQGRGEADPAIDTADEVANALNKRVDILVSYRAQGTAE